MKKRKLSILIPTLPVRLNKMVKLVNTLTTQIHKGGFSDVVQLMVDMDSKEVSIGEKRNRMVVNACGEYVVFIDDDDLVSPIYVKMLLHGINQNKDVITFKGEYWESRNKVKDIVLGMHHNNHNTKDFFYRSPNHLCAIRRVIALKCKYPHINFGEDSEYQVKVRKHIKTECHINDKLYFYHFEERKSQTHPHGAKSHLVE